MSTEAQSEQERLAGGLRNHVVGVALGVLVIAAFIGHARWVYELQTISSREFVFWPLRVVWGLLFLWGIILVVVVRFAPRLPALPTTVALVLLYGALASLPVLPRPLPVLGPWQPQTATLVGADSSYEWQGDVLILLAGAMTAAAMWGWWRYAGARRQGSIPLDGIESS